MALGRKKYCSSLLVHVVLASACVAGPLQYESSVSILESTDSRVPVSRRSAPVLGTRDWKFFTNGHTSRDCSVDCT
ncbi:uncharacterized protein BKA55DRAFT_116983 [Fusarium redolens]|uniref:Uncharacterized protein n=1 Tax=Fusarium redolens TaxID=48865 RepID=A0A9P9GK69_FUSRE|nr:uncharacterized protein BKA55DRAFT_116983 [Fusarium redolens]KAH7240173.1 hypothetical protein BKA55DRAFT_116983 [Fusarium redolens]